MSRPVPGRRPAARLRLPWPLPALLVWAAAWGLFAVLAQAGVDLLVALGCAAALGALGSVLGPNWWRRFMIARAVSAMSRSARLVPTSIPLATRKVLAIPPPMIR